MHTAQQRNNRDSGLIGFIFQLSGVLDRHHSTFCKWPTGVFAWRVIWWSSRTGHCQEMPVSNHLQELHACCRLINHIIFSCYPKFINSMDSTMNGSIQCEPVPHTWYQTQNLCELSQRCSGPNCTCQPCHQL